MTFPTLIVTLLMLGDHRAPDVVSAPTAAAAVATSVTSADALFMPLPLDAQQLSGGTTSSPAPPNEESDILVTARKHDPGDPLEAINVKSFAVTQAIDEAIIRPTALAYQRVLPAPFRDGIRNFLNNLREPVTFLNNLLQFKVGRAARTLGRFAVNSTVGVGGLVDAARRKPFRITRQVNGFANTLGYYGVKTGAFFYLPIVGPTTVRDLIGTTVDRFVLPFAVGKPFNKPAYTIPAGIFGTIDNRAQFDETLETLHHDTPDAYVATREFYLARRQAEIDELHGHGRRIVRPTPGSIKPQVLDPTK